MRKKALWNKDNQGAICQGRCMTEEKFKSFHQEHTRTSSPSYLLSRIPPPYGHPGQQIQQEMRRPAPMYGLFGLERAL